MASITRGVQPLGLGNVHDKIFSQQHRHTAVSLKFAQMSINIKEAETSIQTSRRYRPAIGVNISFCSRSSNQCGEMLVGLTTTSIALWTKSTTCAMKSGRTEIVEGFVQPKESHCCTNTSADGTHHIIIRRAALFLFFFLHFCRKFGADVRLTHQAQQLKVSHQNTTITFSFTTPPAKMRPWLPHPFVAARQQDVN